VKYRLLLDCQLLTHKVNPRRTATQTQPSSISHVVHWKAHVTADHTHPSRLRWSLFCSRTGAESLVTAQLSLPEERSACAHGVHPQCWPAAGWLTNGPKAPQWCPTHKALFVSDVVCPIKANKGIPWLATVFTAGLSKCKAYSNTLVGRTKPQIWVTCRVGGPGHMGWQQGHPTVPSTVCIRSLAWVHAHTYVGKTGVVGKQAYLILSAALSDLHRRETAQSWLLLHPLLAHRQLPNGWHRILIAFVPCSRASKQL